MSLKKDVQRAVKACLKGKRSPSQGDTYECVAERLFGHDQRISINDNRAHAEVAGQVFRALRTRDKRNVPADVRARRRSRR